MPALLDLWLPILLAAVFVFVASSVIHMALPIHKGDYQRLPAETEILDALRPHAIPPGQYMFPCAASMKDMGSPEMLERFRQGPVGYAIIRPNGPPAIGKSLAQWFVFSIAIGVLVGYVASLAIPAGAPGKTVLRVTSAVAFVGYGMSNVTDSIWKGVSWGVTARFLFDGLVYGLITGATFAWLWPSPV